MKKLAISAFLLSTTALAFAQLTDPELQVKVSYETVAIPAGRLIPELSEKSGVKLFATPATENEILVVRVKDAKLADLLEQIAKAASATWRKSTEGWELVRMHSTNLEEQNAELSLKLNSLRKHIDERFKTFTAPPAKPGKTEEGAEPDEGMGMAMGFFGGQAGTKAIYRLLKVNDLRRIAMLEADDRIVFSSSPTRMQLPLQGNVQAIVADLVREHNESASKSRPDMTDPEAAEFLELFKTLGITGESNVIEGRPSKLLLIAGRNSMMGMINVEIRLYDQEGKVLHSGQTMLPVQGGGMFGMAMGSEGDPMEDEEGEESKSAKPQVKDKPIELSKISKEFVELLSFDMGGPQGMQIQKMSPELESRLLRPDLYDPHSFDTSESFIFVAKEKGWNLVASLPDNSGSPFAFGGGNSTVENFIKEQKADTDLVWTETPGWVNVKPKRPYSNRQTRINRVDLAKLIASGKAEGLVSLDALAAYAQRNSDPFQSPVAMKHIMFFAPGALSAGMMGMTEWNVIRFYGTLAPTQKMQAKNGLQLGFNQLNLQQRPLAERILFGVSATYELGPEKEDIGLPFMGAMIGMMGGNKSGTWKQEPTELMPIGLPSNGVLTIKSNDTPVGTIQGDDNPFAQMMGAVGPEELAFMKLFMEAPGAAEMMSQMPKIEKLRMGSRTTYKFGFLVEPEVAVRKQLKDDRVKANGELMDFNNPTPQFRALMDEAYKKLKDNPFIKMMMRFSEGMGRPSQTEPPVH